MRKNLRIYRARSIILLTAALIMIATWAVSAAGWTKTLNILSFAGLGVIVIGLMITRSLLPGLVAHLFSLIIGLGWSFWITSRLLPADYSWPERWHNLAVRLEYWYFQARQGGTSYDNAMFILQMSVIVWIMGYLTIWLIFRSGKVWQAIVPGGVVLLVNLYYAPRDITFWFLFYLIVAFLLVIRFNLLEQEKRWRAEGVFFRPDISFDFFREGLIFSALVLGLAWIAPPVVDSKTIAVFDQFEGSWSSLQGEWNRLYADLNYRDQQTAETFGRSLGLGGPRHLTNEPVMDVKVEGKGRYWRAAVYDYFTGSQWQNSTADSAAFGPTISLPAFEGRISVTQTYTVYRDGVIVLYALGYPYGLDRPARVHFNRISEDQVAQSHDWADTGEIRAEEITYIRSNAAVDQDESYQVVSMVSQATVEQLKAAGAAYPPWISDRYLQLPDTVTDRTRQLARQIAEPFDNPFSTARAIEQHLRNNLTYNEQMAQPPPHVDKVDYVLFTAKEAYCDYYASAMVVMLRSLGIPARLAAGFARGEYNSELDIFHVRNKDAHSWVEVYFPNYGWVEFEPTSAQPNINRPIGVNPEVASTEADSNPTEQVGPDDRPDREGNIPIDDENIAPPGGFTLSVPWFGTSLRLPRSAINGGIALMALGLLGVGLGGLWWWRQQQAASTETIFQLYRRMVRLAAWMGAALSPWQTPFEHRAVLQQRLPGCVPEIETITEEYVYQTYAPVTQARLSSPSRRAWDHLRPEMLKAIFRHHLLHRFRRR